MTGSTCTIEEYRLRNNVYWCESGSGEFSNAVNITKQMEMLFEESTFPVIPVIVGLICGVVLTMFLLLLYHFLQSKDSCFRRPSQSESNNQDSARSHELYQNVAQPDVYSTLLHDDASVYETLQISEDNNAGDDYVNQSVRL
ncbi:uncharacterized protein [Labrus bergylta]|uniref:uncharacterized protein isoform X3 n=1 Tax=Labrus bergylta TaxID=56723 RepID=UPI0033134C6A